MSDHVVKHGERIPQDVRNTIAVRYYAITRAINREFWNSASDTAHSMYVGSYGRGTAVTTSDIDILVEVPQEDYQRYHYAKGNGQSRLLQTVRAALLTTYPRTDIRADGQVVKVQFSDGMKMEILPAFKKQPFWNLPVSGYSYPDTNGGGRWLSTDPKAEQNAMQEKNRSSNGLLFDTCKHIRYIRDTYYRSYHLSGIVIDSFVFHAIQSWRWTKPEEGGGASAGSFEDALLRYYNDVVRFESTITAPGSGQSIDIRSSVDCLGKVLQRIR